MARCNDYQCSCVVAGGEGITVTGSGAVNNPFTISADTTGLSESLRVNDTPTVNLTLRGSGVQADPFILQADSTMKMIDLADVQDPQGGPAIGESPVWVGSGLAGHWEFSLPPANPAGAVNIGPGLTGTGAPAAPLSVSVVGTTAGGPATGLEVYIDTAGNLRAKPPTAQSVDWSTITNKPTQFAPSAHKHPASDITNPLALEVGDSVRVNGHKVTTSTSTTASPPSTGNTAGDLFFRRA